MAGGAAVGVAADGVGAVEEEDAGGGEEGSCKGVGVDAIGGGGAGVEAGLGVEAGAAAGEAAGLGRGTSEEAGDELEVETLASAHPHHHWL